MQRLATVAIVATLLVVLGLSVRADNNPATSSVPAVFPYQGRLELNAGVVNGPMAMRFSLYNAAAGGTAIWTESHGLGGGTPVQVSAGLFTVLLGQTTALRTVIQDADGLYLGVEVQDPGTMQVFEMTGRQQLFPAAWSLWTETANTFNAAGNIIGGGTLSVAGSANVGPQLSVGTNATSSLLLASNASPWRLITAPNNNLELRRTVGTDRLYARFSQDGAMEFFPGGGATAVTFNTDGTITQTGCPTGTSRIGDSCIDNTVHAPATFGAATSTCHAANAHVCTLSEVITCDSLNTPTSDCNALTDVGGPLSAQYWTSTVHTSGLPEVVYTNLACYWPRGLVVPDVLDNVVTPCNGGGSTSAAYWCCRHAR